ncbi:gamma-tubulin [Cyberlindnera jadinii NRRL Y-1542]|uniref:Tubulin gamma chain n=1 Tax=Cyberlindnera jadinii (strain ATCC 18201 / CBS 1600 / BCRC 20928 / JCM 3617 / NBRC 0987 / NRRL Y-1542) TaxID=983966 RepID=A0A1E4S2T0_CYBJN|nr:tubulin nucleotide-binding domain-like protein [Cyberlindnera jadinii NRRL Y-1542]ODV73785.1 tubulin nucleotide-binding domain-like protein [Cyberlindnera jadinii NRRL Y-1542]
MPQIITLQVGQCGNQVGQQFWSQLCREHAIGADGLTTTDDKRTDETNVFFQSNDDKRFTPRALLVDLEPGVINDIRSTTSNLFNHRNIHQSSSGLGAGNIWSKGYDYADTEKEYFLETIDRELDSCDNLEAFQLLHSVAGGTGSGVGSYLLELLSDRYNKKLVMTYSIFPESGQSSDVVVQPYNTVLTLKRLIENADTNVVIENSALLKNATRTFQSSSPTIFQMNQLISTIMSATTNTVRYPGYMYNSMTRIVSTLVPTPDLHFLVPSYTPYTSDFVHDARMIRKSSAYDVVLELLDRKIRMIDNDDKHDSYISIFDILQGDYDQTDIQKSIIKAQQRAKFVPWSSSSVHIAQGKKSPHLQTPNSDYVSGLMLSNNSSIVTLLDKTCQQYDKIMRRNAFIGGYQDGKLFQDGMDEFRDSRETVQGVIDEYRKAELVSYLDDDEDEDVQI